MTDQKRYLTWNDVEHLTLRLARIIKEAEQEYDVLLSIARGGIIPAALLAQELENGMVLSAHLRAYEPRQTESEAMPRIIAFPQSEYLYRKRVLVIDEVHHRGHSLIRAKQEVEKCDPMIVDTAVLHFKPTRNQYPLFKPTYIVEQTDDWIVYPWEQFADKVAMVET